MTLNTLVFLELPKAFDSLSYPILLHKLNSVDNSPETTKWFKSYLTVGLASHIGSTLCSPVMITHSVPGAILLPLLSSFIRPTISADSLSFTFLCG